MLQCRDPAKGFSIYYCARCDGYKTIHYNCNTRLCTKDGKKFTDEWAKRLTKRLFPFPHLRIVFTLPRQLRPYLKQNRKLIGKLGGCILKTIHDVFNYKKPMEKRITAGAVSVLHTFGKDLKFHPHFDCVVTQGGVNHKGEWIQRVIFSKKAIRRVWQYNVLTTLKGDIPGELIDFLFTNFPKGFVVHDEVMPRDQKKKIDYIARYIRHPPLAESRIDFFDDKRVVFHYDDKQRQRHYVEMPIFDFFSALLMHLTEKGKHVIKYSGLYHSKSRPYYFQVLKIAREMQKKLFIAGVRCPRCGSIMELFDRIPPKDWSVPPPAGSKITHY